MEFRVQSTAKAFESMPIRHLLKWHREGFFENLELLVAAGMALVNHPEKVTLNDQEKESAFRLERDSGFVRQKLKKKESAKHAVTSNPW